MAYSTLDLFRRQVVGIDVVMLRMGDKMMRRDVRTVADTEGASVTGQFAGPLSRLLASAADGALLTVLFRADVRRTSLAGGLRPLGVPVRAGHHRDRRSDARQGARRAARPFGQP